MRDRVFLVELHQKALRYSHRFSDLDTQLQTRQKLTQAMRPITLPWRIPRSLRRRVYFEEPISNPKSHFIIPVHLRLLPRSPSSSTHAQLKRGRWFGRRFYPPLMYRGNPAIQQEALGLRKRDGTMRENE